MKQREYEVIQYCESLGEEEVQRRLSLGKFEKQDIPAVKVWIKENIRKAEIDLDNATKKEQSKSHLFSIIKIIIAALALISTIIIYLRSGM